MMCRQLTNFSSQCLRQSQREDTITKISYSGKILSYGMPGINSSVRGKKKEILKLNCEWSTSRSFPDIE